MTINWAHIFGHKCFSSECYLVEVSNRAKTKNEDLNFCNEHAMHPTKEMIVLLKILREPSMFNEADRIENLNRLARIVGCNYKSSLKTRSVVS